MCGIAGAAFKDRDRTANRADLEAMTRALAHRGPDGEGYFLEKGIALGHRRLSVIDLAGGAQPISNEDGTVWVVFNGEIYNYGELADGLRRKGHRFKTRSDTEVIVHAYEEEGPAAVKRFRGMFAFALWDQKKRTLLLARDPVGIKPLFYRLDGEKILFASELKGLLRYPGLEKKINAAALDGYFSLGFIPAPDTVYEDCRKLKPGHYALYSQGKFEETAYWDLAAPAGASPESFAEAAATVRRKIGDAVRSHLVSDVPVGGLLSGGLDSSAVVAFMPRDPANPVSTFTISFDEARFDESRFARETAQRFGTKHFVREVRVQPEEMIRKIAALYDEPFGDASAIPTYYLAQAAREQVKVVLSGDGGDENFGGYSRYANDLRVAQASRFIPRPLRGLLLKLGLALSGKAGTALREAGMSGADAYFHSVSVLKPEYKERFYRSSFKSLLQGSPAQEHFRKVYAQARSEDPLAKMIYADVKTLLPDDYLTKVDRASMAHGLEVRVPLLDQDLLAYSYGLPSSYKIRGSTTKAVMREAMRGILPDTLIHRRKTGFEAPLPSWFRGELKNLFESRLFATENIVSGYFDLKQVKMLWEKFLAGNRVNVNLFWLLLILEMWESP